MSACPCGAGPAYETCCGRFISGAETPETAVELMRSRYSAYVKKAYDYLGETLHPSARTDYDPKETEQWGEAATWLGFEVKSTEAGGKDDDQGSVEFTATYKVGDKVATHHELARFERVDGTWVFSEGEMVKQSPIHRDEPKVGRNDPCPCGSGKKYKKCCLAAEV